MAKNINSVSFTVLLFVFFMATTEILKSDAAAPGCFTFLEECGPAPFLGTNVDCSICCRRTYNGQKVCKGVVEGSDKHCHCYQRTKEE
ncbi:PREDICTED: defensin-like protein 206 [Camelina sativa]|uniref:Defensin-like protein 206 n=1 Tax=Camelina sativa TaxID=90675 RepID=A0ABM1RPZ6_CAMSA|nr:PREDICTED: defensin-like protein 206 [Camelina sativa]